MDNIGLLLWTLLGSAISRCLGQSPAHYSSPFGCANPAHPTTFPACDYFVDKTNECSTADTVEDQQSCFCLPQVLSAIYQCDNEDRLCQGNPAPDMFYSHYVDDFHSICDQYTSFPFTVPPVSSLTTTIQPGHCTPFVSACASGTQFDLACSQSYTGPQLDDCLCAPEVLSLQYTCLYLGNVSCRGVPAALSNIPGWGVCSGYSTIFTSLAPADGLTSVLSTQIFTSGTETVSSSAFPASTTNIPASTGASNSPVIIPLSSSTVPSVTTNTAAQSSVAAPNLSRRTFLWALVPLVLVSIG